jgi:lysophospholipase L1-like esterase
MLGTELGLGLSRRGKGTDATSLPPLTRVVHNLNAGNMGIFRNAMQGVRAGTGRCRICAVGDSTFASGSSDPSRLNSSPMKTGIKLAALGTPTSYFNFFGMTQYSVVADYEAYNSAVDMVGTWGPSGTDSLGGRNFACNGSGPLLTFTPEGAVDTFEVYYLRAGTLGSFTWAVDGGMLSAAVSQTGTNGYLKLTITSADAPTLAAPGTHNITVYGNVGSVVINGIAAYNSQNRAVDIFNFGYRTSTTSLWNVTANPWSPRNALQAHAPDLTLINLGINNWRNDTPANAQFSTDLQAIINTGKLSGDVVIQVPFPSATSGVAGNFCSQVNQQTYVDAIYALSASNNIPLVDIAELFGSWGAASVAGYTLDTLHPSTSGYDLIADQYVSLLQHAEAGT